MRLIDADKLIKELNNTELTNTVKYADRYEIYRTVICIIEQQMIEDGIMVIELGGEHE